VEYNLDVLNQVARELALSAAGQRAQYAVELKGAELL
jgi:hypothetical protein